MLLTQTETSAARALTDLFCNPRYNWDPRNLLDHVHRNVSACDPGGTQLNYLTTSFYEKAPGNPGTLEDFEADVASLRGHAEQLGMPVENMRFAIDEGRILSGPNGRDLISRAVGS